MGLSTTFQLCSVAWLFRDRRRSEPVVTSAMLYNQTRGKKQQKF